MERKEQIVSALDIAKHFDINKSAILYYVRNGILEPKGKIGKMYIFDKEEAFKQMEEYLSKK